MSLPSEDRKSASAPAVPAAPVPVTVPEAVSPAGPSETPPAAATAPRAPGRRDLRAALLLGLLCLVVYNANLRSIGAGDVYPARYLPFGLWRYGTVLFDPIVDLTREGHTRHDYWLVHGRGGHWVSLYPVALPVLVAPLYAPAAAYLAVRGWTAERVRQLAIPMEKLTASLLAAAAVVLMVLVLRRRTSRADALLLAAAFAFGTDTWMIGSQALWQHGLAELLLAGALLLLTAPCTTASALAAGALCGLAAANRPPDAILVAALGLYALQWAGRRRVPWLVLGAAVPVVLTLVYNLVVAGNIMGAYALPARPGFFRNGLLAGAAGLLVSPARGLFVFSPFLLLLPAAFRRGLRDRGARTLTLAIGAAALVQLLAYAKTDWRAGNSWGPRWLTDMLPMLVWTLPPALAALRRAGRVAFLLAAGFATAVQAVGAFWYTGASDLPLFAAPIGPDEMRAAWDPRNTPFIAALRFGPAPPDPLLAPWLEGPDDPAAAARAAAALLRLHQQPAGYWFTTYTAGPRFEQPRQEMNTFLTAMMVDLLTPLPAAAGLGDSVARARAHLAAQIEPSGLVRYHGLPDGPTIPELGCVISPDADDTALVMRLTGTGRPALAARALATLARYRTGDGLYRTWLAPRARYQCIDPGRDPNPADAGIQMHVLLWLAQADPPAARDLCGALGSAMDEDRLWVYYQQAPLVPLLRQADLRRAGCPLQLPADRLVTPQPAQETWLTAGRLLDRLRGAAAGSPPPADADVLAVLRRLADDGFSAIRSIPPMLYHNDLTARARRYYWSEDFGYALWLRLYVENARRHGDGTHLF